MAGKKGRSGPPGNINNCKHPHRAYFKRGVVHKKYRWIVAFLKRYSDGLLRDKPDATEAERRLVNVGETAYGVRMMILEEAKENGFIVKDGNTWDLSPGLKDLPRFLAIERACLQALGLERRAKTVPQLHEYISQRSEANTQTQPAQQGPQHKEEPDDEYNRGNEDHRP